MTIKSLARIIENIGRGNIYKKLGGEGIGQFKFRDDLTLRLFHVEYSRELGWDRVIVQLVARNAKEHQHPTPPTWADMCYIKDIFFNESETVVQYHASSDAHLNIHANVLHLWRLQDGCFPTPPFQCI